MCFDFTAWVGGGGGGGGVDCRSAKEGKKKIAK